jgi:hypothetical protein
VLEAGATGRNRVGATGVREGIFFEIEFPIPPGSLKTKLPL